MGDMVSCPRCRGIFPISQGDASLIDDGKPVAYHGCKVACGATLISSQLFTTTVPSNGAAFSTGQESIEQSFASIGAGLIASYQDEQSADRGRFRGRFQVLDQETGKPVSSIEARVRSTGGQYLVGATDVEGFTQWVERDAAEALAFDIIQQQP